MRAERSEGPEPDARSAVAQSYGVLAESAPIDHELEIRRSRFICRLQRVESEAQARDVIAGRRAAHRLARHHCSAFAIGAGRGIQRSNDDGEPAGTAGTPMLDALVLAERPREGAEAAADLSDVVAVVTRYFGGVLLGAGGLVRAYSESVSSTLQLARVVTREARAIYGLEAPHATAGRWENELRARGILVSGTEYAGASALLSLAVPDSADSRARLSSEVAAVTAGRGSLVALGTEWVDLA
ncbi:IMPACT family protein [Pseudoclavibacter helvolus]|uniref:Putative YigZ family protein n=1 Tax=Pseudoclavibacter helvolus TaxID=255205 RepID=A0A7W4ULB3_9MICO|nr:YigZ family protein [Pseudoclavibacter helvolus]MBB2956513.1 putative YigZ family protein [Pseudoclavibacter helvolus]